MVAGYPNNLARGITRKECVDGTNIHRCVFDFDKDLNSEGFKELSIQWLDNEDAVHILKVKCNKHGDLQFTLGFAVLRTEELDNMIKSPEYSEIHYRRSASELNPFHGSIYSRITLKLREVSAELAMRSKYYEFTDELPFDGRS